jgi:putative flippase GtrA
MTGFGREGLAFIAVGVVATALHFLAMWALVELASLAPQWANICAFCIAFCVSFGGHRSLTFAHAAAPIGRSMPRWMLVSLGGFLLNQSLFVAGLRWLPGMHYLVLWFVVTCAVTLATYLLGKFWAFKG